MLRYRDIPALREHINLKYRRILELEQLEPTAERLEEVRKIEKEAKALSATIRELKGNTYPYAS